MYSIYIACRHSGGLWWELRSPPRQDGIGRKAAKRTDCNPVAEGGAYGRVGGIAADPGGSINIRLLTRPLAHDS